MDQEKINNDLAENDSNSSPFQKKVVDMCNRFVKLSAEQMSRFHDGWDNNDFIYRGYKLFDKDDKDAVKDGEPPKIIVPITYAQTQTAISFILSTFSQRDMFYQLTGSGPEDCHKVQALETDLNYQMVRQKHLFKLYCYLLDTFKYGFGVMQAQWGTDYAKMRISKKTESYGALGGMMKMFGAKATPKVSYTEELGDVLMYEGNKLENISPFTFYPDPSVVLSQFQTGKFVAHDIETSRTAVIKKEGETYFGTSKIPVTIPPDELKDRKRRTGRLFGDKVGDRSVVPGPGEGSQRVDAIVLTEVMVELIPRKATEDFGIDVGSEDVPMKYLAVIGNDRKLIRFEPAGYLHNEFNYCMSEYSPDHNTFYNPGLSDTIYELQNIITFFLNSHIVNVRKIIQNRFVADPSKIEMSDFHNNATVIRLKQAGLPIDRILKQLDVHDVTSQHVSDMDTLVKLVQVVTGINENALGQYAGGRRSATEARSVNAGAAARLKMHAQLIWQQGLEPLGRQILSNTRQGRTQKVYDMIVGALNAKAPFADTILADPESLAGGYDFLPYDATLPSDRQQQAGIFQELLTAIISNPMAAQALNLSPVKLLDHIAELYNIRNMGDFALNPQQNGLPMPPEMQVMPDQQVGNMVADGKLQPMQQDPMGGDILKALAQTNA